MSGVKKKINHRAVFKPRTKDDDNAELSQAVIISARKTGHLNLSSRGLSSVPNRVWTINDLTEQEVKDLHYELDYVDNDHKWWEQEPLKVLDLSSNSLTLIDPKIEYLSNLATLNLCNNLLREIPTEIGNLDKLRKLNLSSNKLEVLPDGFYKLQELRELNLSQNSIKNLDPAIGDLVMLTQLDVSGNNLSELPAGLGYLVRLVSLDISNNALHELPPDLTNMRALQKLIASSNELEILPPFGELRRVETIQLQGNNLTTFPDMSSCTALKFLHLDDNKINELNMDYLEGVGQLKTLTLSHNVIKDIPEGIIKLVSLEIFDLSWNKILKIPDYIGIMPNLKQFVIEGNDIKNVRADIIRCGTPRILKHIRQSTDSTNSNCRDYITPDASTNNYPDKYTMRSTKLLSLAGLNLTELPKEVLKEAQSADVATVDLSRNKLMTLPEDLAIVASTADLKLSQNQLVDLPEWIGDTYKHLQVLDFSKNLLQSLPESLSLLKYLKEINISFNRFTKIPGAVYGISSLEILIANGNSITEIDAESLKNLSKLAVLDLTNNSIGHVPPELGNLKQIRTLLLSGNSFKQPRQAILMKTTEEILAYLRTRIPD